MEDLLNDCYAVDLIAKDVCEHLIVRREEQRVDDLGRRLWFALLVDYPQDRGRGELVRAEVGEMGGKPGGEEAVSGVETGSIQEPRQEKGTIRVCGERNGVEYDGGCDATLWKLGECAVSSHNQRHLPAG